MNHCDRKRGYSRKLCTALIGSLLLPGAASATLINFDELIPAPCNEISCEPRQLTNEYAALGVSFDNGWLESAPGAPYTASQSNVLVGFGYPSMNIYFSGALPTSVSFYVSAALQDALYITAYGADGALGSVTTDGWQGPVQESAPYRDLQLITFSGAEISQIQLDNFYFRRADIIIDDLNFSRDAVDVPEPSMLSLMLGCIGALLWRRHRLTPR